MNQPENGAHVKDRHGRIWHNTSDDDPFQPHAANWQIDGNGDPESWIRVNEYAPLILVKEQVGDSE